MTSVIKILLLKHRMPLVLLGMMNSASFFIMSLGPWSQNSQPQSRIYLISVVWVFHVLYCCLLTILFMWLVHDTKALLTTLGHSTSGSVNVWTIRAQKAVGVVALKLNWSSPLIFHILSIHSESSLWIQYHVDFHSMCCSNQYNWPSDKSGISHTESHM